MSVLAKVVDDIHDLVYPSVVQHLSVSSRCRLLDFFELRLVLLLLLCPRSPLLLEGSLPSTWALLTKLFNSRGFRSLSG